MVFMISYITVRELWKVESVGDDGGSESGIVEVLNSRKNGFVSEKKIPCFQKRKDTKFFRVKGTTYT